MFTLEQIIAAHSKVKSGADFPNFVQDLIKIGVTSYQTFVNDGHTLYFGKENFNIQSAPKYPILNISEKCNHDQFVNDLKSHQQGNTTYPTFCEDCAKSGIEKWIVDTSKMTCSYYDNKEDLILEEAISI